MSRITFTNTDIFGKGFSKTSKTDDACALLTLLEKGILDMDGRITITDSQDDIRKYIWQYIRYIWYNNQTLPIFHLIKTTLTAQTLLESLGFTPPYDISLISLQNIINDIITTEKVQLPYINQALSLALKYINQDISQLKEATNILEKHKNLQTVKTSLYATDINGSRRIIKGNDNAHIKIIL